MVLSHRDVAQNDRKIAHARAVGCVQKVFRKPVCKIHDLTVSDNGKDGTTRIPERPINGFIHLAGHAFFFFKGIVRPAPAVVLSPSTGLSPAAVEVNSNLKKRVAERDKFDYI